MAKSRRRPPRPRARRSPATARAATGTLETLLTDWLARAILAARPTAPVDSEAACAAQVVAVLDAEREAAAMAAARVAQFCAELHQYVVFREVARARLAAPAGTRDGAHRAGRPATAPRSTLAPGGGARRPRAPGAFRAP